MFLLYIITPLINSNLPLLFSIENIFMIDWKYEFTKVVFFNIFFSISFLLFFIYKLIKKENISFPYSKFILFFILVLFISSLLSSSVYISIFWDNSKAHWLITFLNLVLLDYFMNCFICYNSHMAILLS
jgi:hypothetical protein